MSISSAGGVFSSLLNQTLHPALAAQLRALGLTEAPPTPGQWAQFLLAVQHLLDARAPALPALAWDDHHDLTADDFVLLNASNQAVLILAPATERVLAATASAAELYGYSPDALIGLPLDALWTDPALGRHRITELTERATELVEGWQRYETIHRRRDDALLIVRMQSRLIRYQGEPAILSLCEDVTDLRRAQRALALSEERFARIFDASPFPAAVLRASGQLLDANDAMLALLGLARGEALGRRVADLRLRYLDSQQPVSELTPPLRNLALRLTPADGEELVVLASAAWIEIGNEQHILLNLADMTEQKRAEAELRASEARYREVLISVERQARVTALLDQVRTVMAREDDLQSVIRAVIDAIREYFGYDMVSIYLVEGETLALQYEVGYPAPLERIPLNAGVMARAAREGAPILLADVREEADFLMAVPGIRSEIAVPLFAADAPVGVLNVETMDESLTSHDLDLFVAIGAHVSVALQRARLLAELQASNDRSDNLLSSLHEVVFQTDAQGRWTYLNPTWERLSGYPVAEMLGQPWINVVHPADQMKLSLRFARLIRQRQPHFQFSGRFVSSTGAERWCELSGRLIYAEDGHYLGSAGMASDIHERYLAELREREQREMAEALVANAATLANAVSADEAIGGTLAHIARVIPEFDALRAALIDEGMAQMASFPAPGRAAPPGQTIQQWDLQADHLPLAGTTDAVVTAQAHAELPDGLPLIGLDWVRSSIMAPLRSKDVLLGYLYLDSARPGAFHDAQAAWLQGIANQMGTTLHNLRLRADMIRYAQELELRVAERTDQYRQAKEQVETILNTSSDPIVLVSATGRILQANRAFIHVFQGGVAQATLPPLTAYLPGEAGTALLQALQAALQGESQRVKLSARRADGALFPVDAAIDPLAEGSQPHQTAVCSLHDITEHQSLEDSLRAALEHERRLVDLKSRFGIMVSHEFRTPLATIQTSADLLHHYIDRLTTERRDEALETIARQVRHLTTMLDDILAISKADTVGMDFQPAPTDLAELCQSLAEEIRWLDRERHPLRLTIEGVTTRLRLDHSLIQRALMNLLTNAVKYSPDGSPIEFDVRRQDGLVQILIRDHGIGIPEAEMPRLFDTFFRASNVGIVSGTGLGLAIAQRAVEAHNGQISAESEPNQGTTFTILFPAIPA